MSSEGYPTDPKKCHLLPFKWESPKLVNWWFDQSWVGNNHFRSAWPTLQPSEANSATVLEMKPTETNKSFTGLCAPTHPKNTAQPWFTFQIGMEMSMYWNRWPNRVKPIEISSVHKRKRPVCANFYASNSASSCLSQYCSLAPQQSWSHAEHHAAIGIMALGHIHNVSMIGVQQALLLCRTSFLKSCEQWTWSNCDLSTLWPSSLSLSWGRATATIFAYSSHI